MTLGSCPIEDVVQTNPLEARVVRRAIKRETIRGDWDDLFGDAPPDSLLAPYQLCGEGIARNAMLMKKYADREANIRRAWNRTQRYMPELMRSGAPPLDVLELSTTHGAMLEVARHFGHRVMGCDYANMVMPRQGQEVTTLRPLNATLTRDLDDTGLPIIEGAQQDWPYRYICESIDLPISIFDCGIMPYPFADKSYDVTMCSQAIEHYCHPDDWMVVVDEMCRITRHSILLLLNTRHKKFDRNEGYAKSYDAFRLAMRSYDANGFRNVAVHMHWGKAVGFKLIAV